jgi:hypothetical protein
MILDQELGKVLQVLGKGIRLLDFVLSVSIELQTIRCAKAKDLTEEAPQARMGSFVNNIFTRALNCPS